MFMMVKFNFVYSVNVTKPFGVDAALDPAPCGQNDAAKFK
jgi:hypothetical protein